MRIGILGTGGVAQATGAPLVGRGSSGHARIKNLAYTSDVVRRSGADRLGALRGI